VHHEEVIASCRMVDVSLNVRAFAGGSYCALDLPSAGLTTVTWSTIRVLASVTYRTSRNEDWSGGPFRKVQCPPCFKRGLVSIGAL